MLPIYSILETKINHIFIEEVYIFIGFALNENFKFELGLSLPEPTP